MTFILRDKFCGSMSYVARQMYGHVETWRWVEKQRDATHFTTQEAASEFLRTRVQNEGAFRAVRVFRLKQREAEVEPRYVIRDIRDIGDCRPSPLYVALDPKDPDGWIWAFAQKEATRFSKKYAAYWRNRVADWGRSRFQPNKCEWADRLRVVRLLPRAACDICQDPACKLEYE